MHMWDSVLGTRCIGDTVPRTPFQLLGLHLTVLAFSDLKS